MKKPGAFFKISDEFKLDIVTAKSLGELTKLALGEWTPRLRNLYMNKESTHKKVSVPHRSPYQLLSYLPSKTMAIYDWYYNEAVFYKVA